ncbi:MAG: glycosyltransferase family A protein [Ilumatobacteraceae bacterium]
MATQEDVSAGASVVAASPVASNRTIDIAMFAVRTPGRERFLAAAASQLWEWRTSLCLTPAGHGGCAPDLAQVRILLDVVDAPGVAGRDDAGVRVAPDAGEWLLLDAIANGCVVVTNRPHGLPPFVAGSHLLVSPAEYLAEQAVALALDEPRRLRIAAAARAALEAQPSLRAAPDADCTPSLLAAPVADCTPSLPAAPVLARTAHALRPLRVQHAARALLDAVLPTTPIDVAVVRQLTELQTGLKRAYIEQVEATRGLDRALALARGHDADAVVTAATPAYARIEPTVSVVVPVPAHDRAVPATRAVLASIAAAAGRTGRAATLAPGRSAVLGNSPPADRSAVPGSSPPASGLARSGMTAVEVILVGGAADVVAELLDEMAWMPILSVRRVAGGGPVAALNAGLRAARAAYVLPLAAGEELYPNAIVVLLERLAAAPPEVLAAYGIVERYDDDGSIGVGGAVAWDVSLLVRERFLDTIALYRTGALTELGGFCTDASLEGWTNHDVWLAAAGRGWRAAMAGAVVGRTPVLPSAARIDLIDPTSTWSGLYERHPRLPWPS